MTTLIRRAASAAHTRFIRLALKYGRRIVDAADEWLHGREVAFRESRIADHGPQVTSDEFDKTASAIRERAIVKEHHKVKTPRLRYNHGVWVRTEAGSARS